MCGARFTGSMIRMMSLTFRRVLALLVCLMILILPLQKARAAGFAALAGVAGITVLSAYLMASGVYPYITEAGQSVTEWTEDNVQPLLDKYNAYLASIGKSYQITLQGGAPTIRGFLQQGAIVIANDVWGKLREFVQWIQSEYALTDNQLGVQVGAVSSNGVVPIFSYTPTYDDLTASGLYMGRWTNTSTPIPLFFGVNQDGVYAGIVGNAVYMATLSPGATGWMTNPSYSSKVQVLMLSNTARSSTGVTIYYVYQYPFTSVADRADGIPVYQSAQGFFDALAVGIQSDFVGVTVDTTAVTLPEALPADTPWGGLVVEGAGDVASPSVVEGVIAEAIEQREKPAVQPVTITVPPNTEIDPETGQTDPPIVITPFPVPAPTSLELGEELLSALETHFPFSIPWDLYNIFVRLDAQPVAPRFTVTTPALSSGLAPLMLTIDVATTPFSSFAPVFRTFIGILLAIGMLIGASRWIKR